MSLCECPAGEKSPKPVCREPEYLGRDERGREAVCANCWHLRACHGWEEK